MRKKLYEKEMAVYFRKVEGLSLNDIARKVGVAKSSVSNWTKHIELNDSQKERLDRNNPSSKFFKGKRSDLAWKANTQKAKDVRKQHQTKGQDECTEYNLHLAGCMLYWAEGAKSRNSIKFTNTDLDMVKTFLTFLRQCYGVANDKVVITCHSHVLSPFTLSECERYWLKELGLNENNLRKGDS